MCVNTIIKVDHLKLMIIPELLPMYDDPNVVKKLKQPKIHPTPEKVEAIKDALKHFDGMKNRMGTRCVYE